MKLAARVRNVAAAGALIAVAAGAQTIRFEDVAASSGLDFVHQRAISTTLWFPEIMSGGGGWLDYDGDGDLDAYLVQGGQLDPAAARGAGDRLFRNDGGSFSDVTEVALGARAEYGMGLAVGDYDADGDPDVYVTNVGPNVLLRNNGDGTFTDATEQAQVGHPGWGTSAAFIDYDGDGRLDLFVVNYIHWSPHNEIECFTGGRRRDYCHPSNYNAPAADVLYRNRGDGTFEDTTVSSGLAAFFGNGLGVAVADFDQDGRPDLYVANDGMPNQLWMNRGGRFVNEALIAGCAVNRSGAAEAGMGVVAADLDGDTTTDLFMTHLRDETNTLYLNRGGWFEDVTAARGLGGPSIGRTGFGAGAADFDHDGRLDLVVVNGKVGRGETTVEGADPFAEPNQLYRGSSDGGFTLVPSAFVEPPGTSRAAALGDYDGDGDADVLVVDNGGPARLMRNDYAGGTWLRVTALDRHGAPMAGVELDATTLSSSQRRRTERASSYCASHEPAVHFGLEGEASVNALTAHWPGGPRQRWLSLPADRAIVIYR